MSIESIKGSMKKRICVEHGCGKLAGTPWTPFWCKKHDEERRKRITTQLETLSCDFEHLNNIRRAI